jgi:hypothetical protein
MRQEVQSSLCTAGNFFNLSVSRVSLHSHTGGTIVSHPSAGFRTPLHRPDVIHPQFRLFSMWVSACKVQLLGQLPVTEFLFLYSVLGMRRDSAVNAATGYGMDDQGVEIRILVLTRIFSSPRSSDRFWGLPSLLPNWYLGLFPEG